MDAIDAVVPTVLAQFLRQIIFFLSMIVLWALEVPQALIILVLLVPPYYFFMAFYRWAARDLRRSTSVSKSPIYAHFQRSAIS
jgi:hypothetical protein